ncbi:MAG: MBL fold metallo-hydrolase [Thermodesulfobacteriota bacterium]
MISIQWLGTAGFRIDAEGKTFLLDPYLSAKSGPASSSGAVAGSDVTPHLIMVSHGHADHVGALLEIMAESSADLFCNETLARRLMRQGIPRHRIIVAQEGTRCFHQDYRLEVFRARHAPFDIGEAFRGFSRMRGQVRQALKKMRQHPAGIPLSFRISLFCGCRIQHFGSMGATAQELRRMKEAGPIDVLLLPLQRHRGWVRRAAEHVGVLNPRILIPHHHDDSMPPFTEAVDIRSALLALGNAYPRLRIVKLRVMEVFYLSSW